MKWKKKNLFFGIIKMIMIIWIHLTSIIYKMLTVYLRIFPKNKRNKGEEWRIEKLRKELKGETYSLCGGHTLISAKNQFSSPNDHQHPTNYRANLNFLQFLMKVNSILRINNNPSFKAKIFLKYTAILIQK